jgi:hypothetical protein
MLTLRSYTAYMLGRVELVVCSERGTMWAVSWCTSPEMREIRKPVESRIGPLSSYIEEKEEPAQVPV